MSYLAKIKGSSKAAKTFRAKLEKANKLDGYNIRYRPTPIGEQKKKDKDVILTVKTKLKQGMRFLETCDLFGFELVEVQGVSKGELVSLEGEPKKAAPKAPQSN